VSEIDAQAPGQQDLAGARFGAVGHGSAGHDLDGLAGADGKIRRLARADLIGQHTAGRLEQRDHFGLAANARLAQFLDDRHAGLLECKRSHDVYSSELRRVPDPRRTFGSAADAGVRPIGVRISAVGRTLPGIGRRRMERGQFLWKHLGQHYATADRPEEFR
jgi:hypothetical protein